MSDARNRPARTLRGWHSRPHDLRSSAVSGEMPERLTRNRLQPSSFLAVAVMASRLQGILSRAGGRHYS
jgi:hypothetical protein